MNNHAFIARQGDTIYSRLFVRFSRRPSQILRDLSSVLLFEFHQVFVDTQLLFIMSLE
jgi:hypothetical protein